MTDTENHNPDSVLIAIDVAKKAQLGMAYCGFSMYIADGIYVSPMPDES